MSGGKRTKCRLCGELNSDGMYCATCVPVRELRHELNKYDPKRTNMMILDFRAQNGLSIRGASAFAKVDDSRWKTAETDPKKGLTRKVMQKIAKVVGIEVETLFHGYAVLRMGNTGELGRIECVIGSFETPKKQTKPKAIHLPPGVSQKLLAQDCRKAMEDGYGHHYGLWRAAENV